MNEINLRKFDVSKMKDANCAVIGPRAVGKSFLIKDILFHHQDVPSGLVMSWTDSLTHFYDKFVPRTNISDYDLELLLEKVLGSQKRIIRENINSYFVIIDGTNPKDLKDSRAVKEIFYYGRTLKIFFIFTMQNPLGIAPDLRGNIDYTFIFKTINRQDRQKLYENYAGVFSTKEIFEKVLDACTENYGCLVINNKISSPNPENNVFYYKAESHDDLKLSWKNEEFPETPVTVNLI